MLSRYMVELWLNQPLPASKTDIMESVATSLDGFRLQAAKTGSVELGSAKLILDSDDSDTAHDPHDAGPPPEWEVEFLPMTTLTTDDRGEIEQALMQSWWFREAREVAPTCTHRVVITDNLNTGLDYKRRLRDLQRVTSAVVDRVPSAALWWVPSQQFLDPKAVNESFMEDKFQNPLPGAVNVRFYEVPDEAASDESGPFKLMDTLGLYAFGMNDLQICFRGLDPEAVSQTLFNTALYLFDKGPVLRNGESIQGPGVNDRWLCQAGTSLGEPARDVWTLDPGAPFSVEL